MSSIKFYIVDVFAQEKYSGNQLAVFVDLEQLLTAEEMLCITKEINFAESTFIRSREEDGSFGVRIFTTEYEVPFAGHPTLGTAYILAKHLLGQPKEELVLRLKKGDIHVRIECPDQLEKSRFTMQQAQPDFGKTYTLTDVALALDLSTEALDATMPLQEVSTGLPYLIIFLKDLKTIRQLQLNDKKLEAFLFEHKLHKTNSPCSLSTSFFFVTKETVGAENHYHSRMFALEDGKLCEDAATGSANGCLLAYLLKYENESVSATVEQGYEMGRKSLLYLNGQVSNELYTLTVGGRVFSISEGLWSI